MYLAFLLLQRNLETYLRLTLNRPRNLEAFEGKTRLNFAVIHAGAPCCGMNAGKNVRICLQITLAMGLCLFLIAAQK
jgi:hypothetical protein